MGAREILILVLAVALVAAVVFLIGWLVRRK